MADAPAEAAASHKEIVKVWIAPGCIVCDACENDCPEVFEVLEDTCIIRPPALSADFTKPLTPSIITAAEGCPVNVIKFDTIDVPGPEPEAWKKAKEAGPAGGGGGHGGGAGAAVAAAATLTPPDPKWISFLESAHVSGSRSAGGPKAEIVRTAKVSAEAIQQALPTNPAPDAQFAAMMGTGFVKPQKSVADLIRERAAELAGTSTTRRGFAISLLAAWASVGFATATFLAWFQAFMVPRAPIVPPSKIRVGKLSLYSEFGVYEDYKPQNIWVITLEDEGVKKTVALNTVCTHLGCIPNWLPGAQIFKCPCHGSGFRRTGVNFEGPAPRPLERFSLEVDPTGVLIVDKSKIHRAELGQWKDSDAYVVQA